MKKIILSLSLIGLTIGGVTAATVAYYSDSATISANTFSASTMDLKIDNDPSPSVYNWVDGFVNPYNPFATVKPGSTGEQIIDIANVGGSSANATIDLNRTSEWSDLAGVLNFHVYYDGNHSGTFIDTGLTGTVDDFAGPYTLGPITGSDILGQTTASVKIVWDVPTSAGNAIQGDSVTLDTVFGLEQI